MRKEDGMQTSERIQLSSPKIQMKLSIEDAQYLESWNVPSKIFFLFLA